MASTDAVIARLDKAAILRVIHQEPEFSELFIAYLLSRSIRVEADLVATSCSILEQRSALPFACFCCSPTSASEGKKPEPVIAKISQETLAEMIGTTRPRVSFFMNKFRKLGLIEYNGGIEVQR